MGLFSVYTGAIYNDVFAKSTNVFGSSWFPNYNQSTLSANNELQFNASLPSFYSGRPYPFGMDPIWQLSTNKITFTNSIKMKMSVIFGILQMLFGVTLSLLNHCFFDNGLNIVSEFVPQVIFLVAIFGYLIVEIFVKWLSYSAVTSQCAPSLLIGLINMFMFKTDPLAKGCNALFSHQVIVAALAVAR